MGVQHLLIEAIACTCPNEPRRFLCPTGRILLPVPGRRKLVLIRPPVLLLLLLPLGGAVEDMFAQSPDPYPPLWGSRCSRALHKLPPRLYSFLRLTATHLAIGPKETHLARPRRACSLRHMGNQNQPPMDIPDPCAESAHPFRPSLPSLGDSGAGIWCLFCTMGYPSL